MAALPVSPEVAARMQAVLSSPVRRRLAPSSWQVVYYISAYCDLLNAGEIKLGQPVNYCVPTGNFGNILACYYARKMGLPVGRLICASNRNDVLLAVLREHPGRHGGVGVDQIPVAVEHLNGGGGLLLAAEGRRSSGTFCNSQAVWGRCRAAHWSKAARYMASSSEVPRLTLQHVANRVQIFNGQRCLFSSKLLHRCG